MLPPPVRSAAMRRYLRTKAIAFWLFPFLAAGMIRLAFFDAAWIFAMSYTGFTSAVVFGAVLPVLAHRRAAHGLPIKYLGIHSGRRLKILWWPLIRHPPTETEFMAGAMADLGTLLEYARHRGILHLSAYTTEIRGVDLGRVLRHLRLNADWEASRHSASISIGEAVATGLSAFPEFLLSLYVLGVRALKARILGTRGRRRRVPEAYHRHLGVPELWHLSRRAGTTGLSPASKEDPALGATSPSVPDTGE